MIEIRDPNTLSETARYRLNKYGSTLDADNLLLVIKRIADYPEIIEAVHRHDIEQTRPRPAFPEVKVIKKGD